jgi:hypothetical protein
MCYDKSIQSYLNNYEDSIFSGLNLKQQILVKFVNEVDWSFAVQPSQKVVESLEE